MRNIGRRGKKDGERLMGEDKKEKKKETKV
jgi:hypothetical protein